MIIFWLTCLVGYPRTSAPEPNNADATLVFKKENLVPQLTIVYTKKETTGVENVEVSVAANKDAHVYNLQGVRMNAENLPAGIYIKGGKKFVVK